LFSHKRQHNVWPKQNNRELLVSELSFQLQLSR